VEHVRRFLDCRIYWNGKEIASSAELEERLIATAQDLRAPRVNVVPERRVRYERVAQVLALAQRSRVSSLAVTPVADRDP
jgi:biopolymer transport protein ExbD